MRAMRRFVVLPLLGGAAMLVGCHIDKPLSEGGRGRVRFAVSAALLQQQVGALRAIEVRSDYLRTSGERVALGRLRVAVDSTVRDVAAPVDVTTCLRDTDRAPVGSTGGCPVMLTVALLDAGDRVLDSASVGPLDARPGDGPQPVTVSFRAAARLTLATTTPSVLVGDTATLRATLTDSAGNVLAGRSLTWTSSDTTIVAVSSTGVLRGRTPGRTTVTAVRGEVRADAVVWVPAVRSLTLTPGDTTLIATATHRLAVAIVPEPGRGRDVRWVSRDPQVATVDDSGVVTTRAAGTAVIQAVAVADTLRTATTTIRVAPFRAAVGFQRFQPLGNGGFPGNATAVWGARADNVYAVGNQLRRFDGTRWQAVATGDPCCYRGLWGIGPDDLWLVGDQSAGRYRNGTITRFPTGVTGALMSVWAASDSFAIAVGTLGSSARWDGTQWRAVPTGTTSHLWGVWGSSPTRVFAVGNDGTVLCWNGAGWSRMSFPSSDRVQAVWGSDSATVYAGTREGSNTNQRLFRLEGETWRPVATPPLQSVDAIFGSSARDVYVFGQQGLLRGDGSNWTLQALPDDMTGVSNFRSYSGTLAGNRVVLGGYDAVTMTAVDAGPLTTVSRAPAYRGLWAASGREVYAVGLWGTILRFDGSGWTPLASGTTHHLFGVWGSGSTDVIAVGAGGMMLRWDGTSWQRDQTSGAGTTWLWRVWGTDAANVWVGGDGGTILRRSGGGWVRQTVPTTESIRGLWGTDAANVFAVGTRGTVLRWDGATWRSMASATTANLWSVWGAGPDDVYAAGEQGVIQRWDGSR